MTKVLLTADLLAVLAVLLLWLRLAYRHTPPEHTAEEVDELPPDSPLARATAAAGWAQGSCRDWDQHVRPLLARELDDITHNRAPQAAGQRAAAGRALLGAELYSLVDPACRVTSNPDRPGPGRAALERVLDQVERL